MLDQAFRFVGRPVAVTLPAANTDTEVLHQLGEVPDGFLCFGQRGAVTHAPLLQWTKDLAYLRSTVAHEAIVLLFVVFQEDPRDVNP